MTYYTKNVYEIKRNVAAFLKPIINGHSLNEQRFIADMFQGILEGKSLIVSDIARHLKNGKNVRTNFKRLDRHLKTFDVHKKMISQYHQTIAPILGDEKIFLVDDSDIIKPYGNVFEDLGRVRDGSKDRGRTFEKGYHVAQIVGLSKKTYQPIPIAHQIYSEKEREFQSSNYHTLDNILTTLDAFRADDADAKCLFVCDRGYDDGKLFKCFVHAHAQFLIRVQSNRKYIIDNKKYALDELYDKYKGIYKYEIEFQGDYFKRDVKISTVEVETLDPQLPKLTLLLIYGIGEKPMALLTNKLSIDKDIAIHLFKCYFLRWRIEEYFRATKQKYGFENMRVQTLKRMNTLSWFLQLCMGYQAYFIETQRQNALFEKMRCIAQAYKDNVSIWIYQITDALATTFLMARTNLHEVLDLTRTPRDRWQLSLF